jgi:hypothetical protein
LYLILVLVCIKIKRGNNALSLRDPTKNARTAKGTLACLYYTCSYWMRTLKEITSQQQPCGGQAAMMASSESA